MMMEHGLKCHACGHDNSAEARFCNQCGKELEKPAPPVPVSIASLPAEDQRTFERIMGGDHEAAHRADIFYLQIFVALAVVTVAEILLTSIGHDAARAFFLLSLSMVKFAMVIMFFMHLKGDNRLFGLLFLGPLFLACAIAVSVVGMFGNF